MFPTSTQRKYWIFSGETELQQLRKEANERFVKKHGKNMTEDECAGHFLSPQEERLICRHYESALKEFCRRFQPPMWPCVVATALCYFKRFYVHNSVMNYHPWDIMLTCLYLSCKVEEFYVPIDMFVKNLKGDREQFANTILTFELLLMQKLYYHLTVHSPLRPLRGLLIDIQTRSELKEIPEIFEKRADGFVDKSFDTDACLIFSPSQIALAGILSAASKEKINLEKYVMSHLFKNASPEEIRKNQYQIKRIKYLVLSKENLSKDQLSQVHKKLERCRNQENNPESDLFKRKLEEMLEDDEERQTKKRKKIAEEEKQEEEKLLK